MNDRCPDFTHALEAQLDDVHPDLDAIAATSMRRGIWRRRVRGTIVATGSLTAAACLGFGVGALAENHSTATITQVAASGAPLSPSASPSSEVAGSGTVPPPGLQVYRHDPTHGDILALPSILIQPNGTSSIPPADSAPLEPQTKPAEVTLTGWTCDTAYDDKFTCTGPHGKSAQVTWRSADTYADWSSGNPDKTADWVSTVHHGVFITIDGPDAAKLGASLVWK